MVEGARLESVYTRKGIEGSNPSVSATIIMKPATSKGLRVFYYLREQIGELILIISSL